MRSCTQYSTFLPLNLLIDTPRQGSFYLKHALLAPVCQSPAVASLPPLPSQRHALPFGYDQRRLRLLWALSQGLSGAWACLHTLVRSTEKTKVWFLWLWCLCGAYFVDVGVGGCGVGVDPAPGGMVARGVGNLYTWRSRRGVRESMICRYDGTAHRKKVSGEENWGAERRLIYLLLRRRRQGFR